MSNSRLGDSMSFGLFGTDWILRYIKKVESKSKDKHWIFGNNQYDKGIINISALDKTSKAPVIKSQLQLTALHELTHAILTSGQYLEETQNEALVEWIARSMLTLYKQGVFHFIMKEESNEDTKEIPVLRQ